MSKEEKAKEYSKKICSKSCRSQCEVYDLCTIYKERIKNYLAGYTQAEQDLSSQLTAYKEALTKAIPFIEDAIRWYEIKGSVHQEFISEDKEFLTKAKTLI